MASKARFYPQRPTADGLSLIMMRFSYKGAQVYTSTGESVEIEHWDAKEQRVAAKYCRRNVDYLDVNLTLDKIDQFARSTYNDHRRRHDLQRLTPARFKGMIQEVISGRTEAERKEPSVLTYYRQYHDDRLRNANLGAQSEKSDKVSMEWFARFVEHLGYPVRFGDVNLSLFEQYRDYFWHLPDERTDSTIYKHLRKFRQLCIHAAANGKSLGCDIASIKLKSQLRLSPKAMDTIALYTEELEYLASFHLASDMHSQVRDLFIAGCCTGLRFNRWGEIKQSNIIEHGGQRMLSLFTQKGTRKQVVLPLHPMLETIGRRYDWQLPQVGQTIVNRYIKQICEIAGMTERVQLVRNIQGRSKIVSFPKYELVSSHTARRSFATNAHAAGIPLDDIQAMTGHSDRKTLLHYIKEDGKRRAARLKTLPYYQT